MDADSLIERIKSDHRRVLAEVSRLESLLARGGATRPAPQAKLDALVRMLEREFGTHMAAEDEALYPAVVAVVPAAKGSVEPLHDEHAELRAMLERLRETMGEPGGAERDEQVTVQVADLAALLRIHIRKEESLVLSVAARLLRPQDIDAIVKRMHPERSGEGARPTTTAPTKGDAR
ncbi:MAG TPA: hemerythrin domain-containing protein [Candidatus Eisenbacteria bacterium]